MVDAVNLSNVGNSAISLLTVVVWIIVGLIALGVIILIFILIRKKKRFSQFKCVIWRTDSSGRIQESYDRAGIFLDGKTKNKRFFLERSNVGLDPDNVPDIPTPKGKRTVYLLQTGLKNFHFIRPSIAYPAITLSVGEEDVNWATNAYERTKNRFMQNTLLQWMPFILLAFVSIVILIIFIYFFKNFDVLRDVAISLQETARTIATITSNSTTILQ